MFQRFFLLKDNNTIEEVTLNVDKIVKINNTHTQCMVEGIHPMAEVFIITMDNGENYKAVGLLDSVLSEINSGNKRILKG